MRKCFEWLVRHEKIVVIVNVVLVIALVVQLKFCNNTVEPENELVIRQSAISQNTALPTSPNNITGKWEMSVQKPKGGAQIWTLTLSQNGEQLSGVLTSEGGDLPVTGTIKGQSIELSAKRFGVTLEFPATLNGDVMNGTMRVLTLKRQWTARRI